MNFAEILLDYELKVICCLPQGIPNDAAPSEVVICLHEVHHKSQLLISRYANLPLYVSNLTYH